MEFKSDQVEEHRNDDVTIFVLSSLFLYCHIWLGCFFRPFWVDSSGILWAESEKTTTSSSSSSSCFFKTYQPSQELQHGPQIPLLRISKAKLPGDVCTKVRLGTKDDWKELPRTKPILNIFAFVTDSIFTYIASRSPCAFISAGEG